MRQVSEASHLRGQRQGQHVQSLNAARATGINERKLAMLRHGLQLDGRQLRYAKVKVVERQLLRFVLKEGRNRQIRRMCELVDLHVVDLLRVRIGSLKLGDLPEGRWRPVTPQERAELISPPAHPERLRPKPGG